LLIFYFLAAALLVVVLRLDSCIVLAAVGPYESALITANEIKNNYVASITFLGPFGMDDPDFITSTVEDDGVSSSMTDYADSSETLRVRAVTKAASDLSVPLEIDDFVDHGLGTIRPAWVALNPSKGANCNSVGV
jgi:hypothetical protein